MGKDSGSPPPAPDYTAAAKQQGVENLAAAQASAKLSNPNITSPLGTRTMTYGGGAPTFNQSAYDQAMKAYTDSLSSGGGTSGGWSTDPTTGVMTGTPGASGGSGGSMKPPNPADFYQTTGDPNQANETISLSPEQQALYSGQNKLAQGLLGLGQGSLDQTSASLSKPQDLNSVQDIANQSYGLQTSRLDPQWQQNQQQFDAKMADQGIPVGSEAYNNANRQFQQSKNDAYNQARLSSINTMPQTYQLSTAERMQPLTELNAIRSGSQPQMPQFQPTSPVNVGAAPVFNAANLGYQANLNNYNAGVGQQNSMMSGLFGLGSAALMGSGGLGGLGDLALLAAG